MYNAIVYVQKFVYEVNLYKTFLTFGCHCNTHQTAVVDLRVWRFNSCVDCVVEPHCMIVKMKNAFLFFLFN